MHKEFRPITTALVFLLGLFAGLYLAYGGPWLVALWAVSFALCVTGIVNFSRRAHT